MDNTRIVHDTRQLQRILCDVNKFKLDSNPIPSREELMQAMSLADVVRYGWKMVYLIAVGPKWETYLLKEMLQLPEEVLPEEVLPEEEEFSWVGLNQKILDDNRELLPPEAVTLLTMYQDKWIPLADRKDGPCAVEIIAIIAKVSGCFEGGDGELHGPV